MLNPSRPIWFYHLMALTTITIWSFSFLFIIRAGRELTPLGVVAVRKDIFLLLVLGLLVWRRPSIRQLSRRDWAVVIGLSFVGGPLYHVVFAWASGVNGSGESRIDPGLLGLILATVPVHAGWLAWIFLRERLTIRRIVALGLGLCGVGAVMVGRFGRFDLLPLEHLEGPIGATLSAVVGAGIVVLMRAARVIYRPLDLVAVSGAIIVLMCLPLHPFADLGRVFDLSASGWLAIIFLGICGSGIAFLTWATALSGLPAVTTAMYLFMAAVLSATWGWLFESQPVGWPFFLGAGLVLGGLLIMATGRRNGSKQPRQHGGEVENRAADSGPQVALSRSPDAS